MRVEPRLIQVERRSDEVRTPGSRLPDVRRLVIVRHDRLGDFVLTLPAIDRLRRTYPDAELALIVAEWIRPLAKTVKGVDRVFTTNARASGVKEALLEFRPDLAVCVSRGAAFAVAAARAGVRHRVGTGLRYYSPLFTRSVDERRRSGGRHELEYALSFAHRAGASPGPVRFPLRRDQRIDSEVARWLETYGIGERFVLLHPGSAGSCPRWPLEHFLELARRLIGEGLDLVISVGPSDDEVRGAVSRAESDVNRSPVFRAPLPYFASLTRRASLVVSNATGSIHVAVSQGTPTLALHVPWTTCGVPRWGPYDARGFGLVADTPAARNWSRHERRRYATDLMAGLRPDTVLSCTMAMLEGRQPTL